jgi:hypothetical protein
VEPERAHDLVINHRKTESERDIPLSYLQDLRRAYLVQLRAQAATGNVRILLMRNQPHFLYPQEVLDALEKAPSAPEVCALFDEAEAGTLSPVDYGTASPAEISGAFNRLHGAYHAYYHKLSPTPPPRHRNMEP